MRRLLPLLLLFFTRFVAAGVPYQVVDLKVTPDSVGSSQPLFGGAVNGRILFSATTPTTGEEAWSTDGTAAGTVLLKDIAPGPDDSYAGGFVTVGSVAYFVAYIGSVAQTWQTDSTPAGTRRTDVTGYPLAALGNKLLTLDDSNVLRITDGTASGTTLLASLGRGTNADFGFVLPADNGSLYIAAGFGLWRTDGTPAGTKLLNGVHVANGVKVGSSVIFIGSDATTGREPWISDGTAAGTHMIRELVPGTDSAFGPIQPISMAATGNHAIFATLNGDVWSTDGTASGTSIILKGPAQPPQRLPMISFNGYVYFSGADGSGQELWRTDGTAAGTALFKDINPGAGSSNPIEFTTTTAQLFFYADDGTHGSELWATDGSVAGTRLVRDIDAGPSGSLTGLEQSFAFGDRIYFQANDRFHGSEPWVSDGTESGTQMIADLYPQTVGSSFPYVLVPAADRFYFVTARSDDTSLPSLWTTDGSASGTTHLFTFTNTLEQPPVAIGNTLFFTSNGDLWKSDGTASGTTRLKALSLSNIDSVIAINDHLYIHGYSQQGYGTSVVDENGNSVLWLEYSGQPVPFAGKVYYDSDGHAIAYTDGTPAGTHVAWHIPAGLTKTSPLYPGGGSLFFFMATHPGGTDNDLQLWKSNGTAEGTQLVKSLGAAGASSKGVAAAGQTLFFVLGTDLWRSDGTADGTFKLKTIGDTTFAWSDAFAIAALGDRVLFVGTDADHGRELWVSDGTAESCSPTSIRVQRRRSPSRRSASRTASCISPPTTAAMAPSCGRSTAPPRERRWLRTSSRDRPARRPIARRKPMTFFISRPRRRPADRNCGRCRCLGTPRSRRPTSR
jgi:ELWxxDGT repeat protein